MKKYCLVYKCVGLTKNTHVDFILAKDDKEAEEIANKLIEHHASVPPTTHFKYYIENLIEITDDKCYTMEKIERIQQEMNKFIQDFINDK